jgi:hypothetical protein
MDVYTELLEHIKSLKIIDTHEHLPFELGPPAVSVTRPSRPHHTHVFPNRLWQFVALAELRGDHPPWAAFWNSEMSSGPRKASGRAVT